MVSQSGGVLLLQTVRATGLEAVLSTAMRPWRKPTARHDPGKVVRDLALALALGGDCLADIAVLRGSVRPGGLGSDGVTHDRRAGRRRRVGVGSDRHRPRRGWCPRVASGW